MKGKVCHLTSVHPAKDGRIFYKECSSLAKAGYDVTLVAAGADNEVCNGVKIVGVPVQKPGRLHRMTRVGRDVYRKALEIDADIYHIHDPELLPFALKLKKKGKKVIFDSHEFVAEQIRTKEYIPSIFRGCISGAYKLFEGYICRKLDAVIEVCTLDGKDYFEGRCKHRVFITNAPIIEDKNLCSKTSDLKGDKVVHVGGLTYERGIKYLAEAAVKADCQLVLAGQFSSPDFEAQIKSICGERLEYCGVILSGEVPELLSQCSIGTCTLLDKGQYAHLDILPTKIYDYMSAGLPVIMSDFPFLKQFNKENQIGICVKPDDAEAIASAIEYLSTHSEEAQKMGKNGQQLVLKKLNWASQEEVLTEFYSSLI